MPCHRGHYFCDTQTSVKMACAGVDGSVYTITSMGKIDLKEQIWAFVAHKMSLNW